MPLAGRNRRPEGDGQLDGLDGRFTFWRDPTRPGIHSPPCGLLAFPLLLGAGRRLFSESDKDATKLKLVEDERITPTAS